MCLCFCRKRIHFFFYKRSDPDPIFSEESGQDLVLTPGSGSVDLDTKSGSVLPDLDPALPEHPRIFKKNVRGFSLPRKFLFYVGQVNQCSYRGNFLNRKRLTNM